MPVDIIPKESGAAKAEQATEAADRRRPGRPQNVSPALIELLRWRPNATDTDWEAEGSRRAAQGILIGTVVGLLIWAGALFLVRGLLN